MSSTEIECVVCERCLEQVESAGQLVASSLCGSKVQVPEECEQCGDFLIDGQTYRVIVEP